MVSLNRSSVASRLPVELLRSTRVSLKPFQDGVDLLHRDVGVERGLRELADPLGPGAGAGLAAPLSAMTAIMTTRLEPSERTGRLNQM